MTTTHIHATTLLLSTVLLCLAGPAVAQDAAQHPLGQHPAVLVQRQQRSIDPNLFIVAHPARLLVVAAPTPTFAHPAVVVQRLAAAQAALAGLMDQPPVASAWLGHREVLATSATVATVASAAAAANVSALR